METLQNVCATKLESLKDAHNSKIKSISESHQSKLDATAKKSASNLSKLTIRNKQLSVLEELSRKTAEELLIETHDLQELKIKSEETANILKALNIELESKINELKSSNARSKEEIRHMTIEKDNIKRKALDLKKSHELKMIKYFPLYNDTKDLSSAVLIRRAEKRIKNKNFRSAKELLLQAYCMDKKNRKTLIRILAVSIKNPAFRSITLWLTALATKSKKKSGRGIGK